MFFSRSSEKGMGLVEVMVASVMLLAVVSGIAKYITNMQKVQNQMTAVSVRNGKVNVTNAILEASAPRIISVSINDKAGAPLCQKLKDCILSPGACPSPYGSCTFQDTGGSKVTGSDSDPMRLTLDGRSCSNASAKCPLEVIGRFRRTPTNSIEVWTVVRQSPNIVVPGMNKLDSYNEDEKKGFRSIIVPISKIQHSCKVNERLVGYEADGTITCKPVVDCKENERLVGYAADGTITCKPVVNTQEFTAIANKTLPPPPGTVQCKPGELMNGLTPAGTPVCMAIPFKWQFNNSMVCFENNSLSPDFSCNQILARLNYPPKCVKTNGVMQGSVCDPKAGTPFCHQLDDTGIWAVHPSPQQANRIVIDSKLRTTPKQMGSYLTSCNAWGGNNSNVSLSCNGANAPTVSEATGIETTPIPVQLIKTIHLMRCVSPLGN